ncbi:Hypp5703 [Branchiostoma lanceolatum]|uniref:Hypp5703 protein n=1 Tax=Branchiostoma lanceolatum TaxID=7740 RepID=A0A8J9YSC9_BRALA|nr:Hypp5703 [Branchiostoma lanceolatum]
MPKRMLRTSRDRLSCPCGLPSSVFSGGPPDATGHRPTPTDPRGRDGPTRGPTSVTLAGGYSSLPLPFLTYIAGKGVGEGKGRGGGAEKLLVETLFGEVVMTVF